MFGWANRIYRVVYSKWRCKGKHTWGAKRKKDGIFYHPCSRCYTVRIYRNEQEGEL